VQAIEDDHVDAARKTLKNPELLEGYITEVKQESRSLVKILESAQNLEEVSSRAYRSSSN
jgi:aspartate kinase